MAMLEYINCSFTDDNYKKILTLREKGEKDDHTDQKRRTVRNAG